MLLSRFVVISIILWFECHSLFISKTFESLLPPSPYAPITRPANAHLNLAQLNQDPRQCLEHYQAAVDALVVQLKGKEQDHGADADAGGFHDEEDDEIKIKIIGALAAMVEIWMSDLWYVFGSSGTRMHVYFLLCVALKMKRNHLLKNLLHWL